ncbi:uncharacterized protein LOC134530908 isoform X2 [Bacillus rossius redtenbacheri]|uniref:uncharacterized protein LOC134530908 isoform X2 n=1 Tax=Bacillus rossius redtenbacheri TaxID=93214 RepID=UPI002FDD0E1B
MSNQLWSLYQASLHRLEEHEDVDELKLQLLHTWVADLLAQNASLVDAVEELEERAIAQQLVGQQRGLEDSAPEEQRADHWPVTSGAARGPPRRDLGPDAAGDKSERLPPEPASNDMSNNDIEACDSQLCQLRREVKTLKCYLSDGKAAIVEKLINTLELVEKMLETPNPKVATAKTERSQFMAQESQRSVAETRAQVAHRQRELREMQDRLVRLSQEKARILLELQQVAVTAAQYPSQPQHASEPAPPSTDPGSSPRDSMDGTDDVHAVHSD